MVDNQDAGHEPEHTGEQAQAFIEGLRSARNRGFKVPGFTFGLVGLLQHEGCDGGDDRFGHGHDKTAHKISF